MKLAQAGLLQSVWKKPPLLLFDDIFGELDPARRNALLAALPVGAQQLITTTHLDWLDAPPPGPVWQLSPDGRLRGWSGSSGLALADPECASAPRMRI